MIIRFLIVSLALGSCITLSASAEDVDVKKVAKAKAEELNTALIKGDFEKAADLTHPKALELVGGKEKMIAAMMKLKKNIEANGGVFKTLETSEPSDPIKAGKELYILVSSKQEIKFAKERSIVKVLLIGVSDDGGKTWVFVATTQSREKIKLVLPNLPESLVIPKYEPPTIIKD